MVLTDEEKRVFDINDKEEFNQDSSYIERLLYYIHDINPDEEKMHIIKTTLNFIKRMIIEYSQKKGYNITGNESYNIDDLLNEIIVPSNSNNELLSSFHPLLYKNEDEFKEYFSSLTSNLSWENIKELAWGFNRWVNIGFTYFLVDHMNSIESLTSKLYYELEKMENGDFAQKTSMECNENDDDWADSNLEEDNKELESYPIFTKDELSDFADWEDGSETTEFDAIPNPIELDEKTLLDYVKLINVAEELIRYRDLGRNITNNLYELSNQKKLEDFYSNEEFSSMFDLIMNHDKNKSTYYFHGTQCLEDAESIIDTGLGMMKSSLSSTTYKEFTKDDVIMYERGFGGEIGHFAVVILDAPKNDSGEEINIVTPLKDPNSVPFSPSGLQGLEGRPKYIVLPENIVGYVDKINKKIVFNPKYRNYDQLSTNVQKR